MAPKTRPRRARAAPSSPERAAAAQRAIGSTRIWGFVVALVLAAALAYANTLSNPFLFDDVGSIPMNAQIRDLADVQRVFAPPPESPVAGRPLVNLSLALNYAIGGVNVRGYHLVNIALHVACALLLFAVARRTLDQLNRLSVIQRDSVTLAFAIALLWTVHPLNSEVVDYVVQRTESMMALMYLLALYASIRAAGPSARLAWGALAVAASAAGMACKESMATLPVVVLLYDHTFLFHEWRAAVRERWRLYAALAATWLVLAALMLNQPRTSTAGFASTPVSVWTYLLNQTVMIARYLRLAVWPDALVLYYGWPRHLTLGDVWGYAVLIVALLALTIVLLVRRPLLAFLGAWFFITLAPASSIVPVGSEVGAERRMYLPLIAVVALVVLAVDALRRRLLRRAETDRTRGVLQIASGTAVLLVAAAGIVATHVRNTEYASGLTMARTVLARWPTPVAEHMVGTELVKAGRHQEAIPHLRAAAIEYAPARYALGLELVQEGNRDEAIQQLQQFIEEEPRSPSVPAAHRFIADALTGQRRFAEAVDQYRAYLQTGVADADAWNRLGVALASAGRADEALTAYRTAVRLQPDDPIFRLTLASALLARGDIPAGAEQAREAVRLAPQEPRAHELLGRVFEFQGRIDDARREYEAARQLDPNDPIVQSDLQRIQGKR
jgi:protein O-mannosyl-transferase